VFDETGKLVSFVPAYANHLPYLCMTLVSDILPFSVSRNSVTGWGKLDGRKVFVTADDFSVRGGHADGGIMNKPIYGEVSVVIL
jgi:acetyl-CoA carboxylase carboxyltransferase component